MRFPDDITRDTFHKQQTMLQVICSLIENYCFRLGHQVDVVRVEPLLGSNGSKTWLSCDGLDGHKAQIEEVARIVNTSFRRRDKEVTCLAPLDDKGVFHIYVTAPADLLNLN